MLLLSQPSEQQRLETLLKASPGDPVVLYNLAAIHAAAGRRADAIQRLHEVSRTYGGLDPSFYRGFFAFRGDSTYERVLRDIRRANPPIVRSTRAFRIAERDLQPEGIAFDPVSHAIFAGSFKGKVVHIDARGVASDFARVSTADAPRVVVGVRVDSARRHLWVTVDDPRAFGDATLGGSALHQYDIATGALVAQFRGPPVGALNDVAVDAAGVAYATNTSDGSIWRAAPGTAAMSMLLSPGSIPEANGIAISPDNRTLFVAGWHDIIRVDVRSGALDTLIAPRDTPLGSFDGLYWYRDGLVGVQNGIHPGRVVRLSLDRQQRRVVRSEILERYHPLFNGVTTGAIDGSSLLYFANTQSRAFGPDGAPRPGITLDDIVILRLPLW